MRVAAILPVKRFGAAKSRLATAIPAPDRSALAAAMVTDALAALARAELVEMTIVVTGEPEAISVARDLGAIVVPDPTDESHSVAAGLGVARAMSLGAEAVAMLPGDCPLLDAAELDRAIFSLRPPEVVVVPDRHGAGTNGLILSPPDAVEPSFGDGSHARHHALAREAGVRSRTLALASLALDADTPDDLELIRRHLLDRPERGNLAPQTRRALERLRIKAA